MDHKFAYRLIKAKSVEEEEEKREINSKFWLRMILVEQQPK